MQAERKELVTNDLVKQINRAYEGIKQGPSRNTILFLVGAGVVVLIGVLFWYFWRTSAVTESHRWLALDEAVFPDQISELVNDKEIKDTPQHRIARFKEARMKMAQGLRDLGHLVPSEREKARKNLEEAVKIYEELVKTSSRTPQLHQEAIWGAAKGYEALGGTDNIDEAIKLYRSLEKEYPKSALGNDARKQLERLESPSTQKDLKEIHKEFGK